MLNLKTTELKGWNVGEIQALGSVTFLYCKIWWNCGESNPDKKLAKLP